MHLRTTLRTWCGREIRLEPLNGLSGRRVVRALGSSGSVIVKVQPSPTELAFYSRVAPQLSSVSTPQLLATMDTVLVLEDIPNAFPRARWEGDAEALHLLAQLHRSQPVIQTDIPLFISRWPNQMTEVLLRKWSHSHEIGHGIRAAEQESQAWLTGSTPVSGDPNPRNWGLRSNGELVLFDWERFGFATPAVDLAITVPGLGTRETFHRLAEQYLQVSGSNLSPLILARGIALMKLWTAVEFVTSAQENPQRDEISRSLLSALPTWFLSTLS